jgi:predicted esterase
MQLARIADEEHSALAFRVSRASASTSVSPDTLILLPGAPGSDAPLLQAVRAAGWTGKVISLLPPRAIYCGEQVRGFTWFHVFAHDAIEPTSFHDSLWHLERFVLDLLEQGAAAEDLVLIGAEEGASLLLAALPYLYDRIAGAAVIGGHPPRMAAPAPPNADLREVPVWLIQEDDSGGAIPSLAAAGACLRVSHAESIAPMQVLRDGLTEWLCAVVAARGGTQHHA